MISKIKSLLYRLNNHISQDYRQIQKNEISRALMDVLATIDKNVGVDKNCEHNLVVSLTTFGERIFTVHKTIESLMLQTLKPNHIVLWLAEDEYGASSRIVGGGNFIPIQLKEMEKKGLEIRYCEDIRSYKKLIPTLELYPDSIIVTVDDDMIYSSTLLETLYYTHLKYPDCVVFNYGKEIKVINKDNVVAPYSDWKYAKFAEEPSHKYIAIGVGGVLYPPHSLNNRVKDVDLFKAIAPFADDLWFKAMAYMNGIKYIQNQYGHKCCDEKSFLYENITVEDSQTLRLGVINVKEGKNDEQWKSIMNYLRQHNRDFCQSVKEG